MNHRGIEDRQKIAIVPGCPHDDECMFLSPQFRSAWAYLAASNNTA